MLSSSVTLTFQAAHGHALRQLPLHADVQNQGGQHYQHKTCIHRAVLGGALLRLHQVQKTYRQGAGALVELIRVMEMIYSFQKDRKLNRIMVMMEGFAMGKMMRVMVEK